MRVANLCKEEPLELLNVLLYISYHANISDVRTYTTVFIRIRIRAVTLFGVWSISRVSACARVITFKLFKIFDISKDLIFGFNTCMINDDNIYYP